MRLRRGQLGDLEAIGPRCSKRSGNRRLPVETAGKAKIRRENVGGRQWNRAGDRLEIELRSGAPLDRQPAAAKAQREIAQIRTAIFDDDGRGPGEAHPAAAARGVEFRNPDVCTKRTR
jgi:hypothetical protein